MSSQIKINHELKINDKLSGNGSNIYVLVDLDTGEDVLNRFISQNINSFKSETKKIVERLTTIGKETGAREHFFRTKEGNPGDGVCAVRYSKKKKRENLRLYCIRFGTVMLILGGGGPKNVRALQEDQQLARENYIMRKISQMIIKRLKAGELRFESEGRELVGNTIFRDEDE